MIDAAETMRRLTLNVARLSGAAALARPLLGGIGAILMLHRVTAVPAGANRFNRHLSIHPAFLDGLVADMKAGGYDFVSMDEACARIAAAGQGRRFATITLDDGYRDNLTEALPVFEKHGVPFAVYVAPGLIDRTVDLWWEVVERIVDAGKALQVPTPSGAMALDCSTPSARRRANAWLTSHLTGATAEEDQRALVRDLARSVGVDPEAPARESLMDWDELRQIAAHPLATVGAHTVHHYALARLPDEPARREIADCAAIIERQTGTRPKHFAFPYGYAAAAGAREARLAAEAGYVSAVTTRHGLIHPAHAGHMHALPRVSVNGNYQQIGHMRTLLSGIAAPLANGGRVVVTV